jgi:hypothetical protein
MLMQVKFSSFEAPLIKKAAEHIPRWLYERHRGNLAAGQTLRPILTEHQNLTILISSFIIAGRIRIISLFDLELFVSD